MVTTLDCNRLWGWGHCLALCGGGGEGGAWAHVSACARAYIYLNSQEYIVVQHQLNNWPAFTKRQNMMIASPVLWLLTIARWLGKHSHKNKNAGTLLRGCFLRLSPIWTSDSLAFSKRQSQRATDSCIWGWRVVCLNLDVVRNRRTILVIPSILKLKMKNVPAELQGLRLEVQFPSLCAANGPWN